MTTLDTGGSSLNDFRSSSTNNTLQKAKLQFIKSLKISSHIKNGTLHKSQKYTYYWNIFQHSVHFTKQNKNNLFLYAVFMPLLPLLTIDLYCKWGIKNNKEHTWKTNVLEMSKTLYTSFTVARFWMKNTNSQRQHETALRIKVSIIITDCFPTVIKETQHFHGSEIHCFP